MGDKTPESLSMDQYFERLRSDHSPSVLARSGRTARCKPRSRLSARCPESSSKKRLVFDDEGEAVKKRKAMRPVDVVEVSSSQSTDDDSQVHTKECSGIPPKGDSNKRRLSFSFDDDSNDAKVSVNEEIVAARSPSQIVPFEDQNGNNCLVRPEMRRVFSDHREVDEQSRKESIERARRVRAMEQFQKEVLNSGEDWEDYRGSEVETDLDEELFDELNDLHIPEK